LRVKEPSRIRQNASRIHVTIRSAALGQEVRLDVVTFLNAWRSRGRRAIVLHR
jgi:hypothetical protein